MVLVFVLVLRILSCLHHWCVYVEMVVDRSSVIWLVGATVGGPNAWGRWGPAPLKRGHGLLSVTYLIGDTNAFSNYGSFLNCYT